MLQTKLLLQPHGQKLDISIGDVFIALIGTSDKGNFGTYKYYIRVPKSQFNRAENVHGVIYNHDRRQNGFRLLQKILNTWGDAPEFESELFMNYIQGEKEYQC